MRGVRLVARAGAIAGGGVTFSIDYCPDWDEALDQMDAAEWESIEAQEAREEAENGDG